MTTNNVADHCPQCGKPHAQADIDGGRCLACGTMLCAEPEHNRFTIVWRDSAYRVSIPNYGGGEVVTAEFHDAEVKRLSAPKEDYKFHDAEITRLQARITQMQTRINQLEAALHDAADWIISPAQPNQR